MTRRTLVLRSLAHFWRTHLAVLAGVAVAVSVLAGALLVGDSVRGSLRDLVLARLGRADLAVTGAGFFRADLASDLAANPAFAARFAGAAPMLVMEGALTHEPSGRRASRIHVYGVDDRFFAFHGREGVEAPSGRQALLSPGLASELGAAEDDALLLRLQKPSAIPTDTLQGRRDDATRAIRLMTRGVLAEDDLGEFTIRPQQDAVRALFVPLSRLQRDLDLAGRANVILAAATTPDAAPEALVSAAGTALDEAATLDDLGLKLVPLAGQHALSLESETGLLPDDLARIARGQAAALGYDTLGALTYLANSIRIGDRAIPYSVVTGLDLTRYRPRADAAAPAQGGTPPIWLNAWAVEDLAAKPGNAVTLEYFLWDDDEGLTTSQADFTVAGEVAMSGAGGDRTLTPEYPGLTDAGRMGDWDPPFPVDLRRIRQKDEQYWDDYRAAPKAFVSLEDAQRLWGSAYGRLTSLRVYVPDGTALPSARDAFGDALRARYTPAAAGLAARPVRAQALSASLGTTDFGEYFFYFSFFLVVSGLLLTGLFFKLGIEQRAREVGLLAALGFTARDLRRLLLAESAWLAVAGSAIGMAGAIGFSSLILLGLRTWWVDAVGTDRLALHVVPGTLVAGAAGGVLIAVAALAWTLRRLGRSAPRDLLSGAALSEPPAAGTGARGTMTASFLALVAASLVAAAWTGAIDQVPAFFGAGALLLVAALTGFRAWLGGTSSAIAGSGVGPLSRLGARQATYRPGRSVLSVALIALATFVVVAVGAFRRGAPADPHDPASGTGGYALYAESVAPLVHDPTTMSGREGLALSGAAAQALDGVRIHRFRLRPGDDGSCLNLYRPTSPRILGAPEAFVREGRFSFASSLAESEEERRNPWLLLDRRFEDGAVPVIGDANSLAYALHVAVGDDFLLPGPGGEPVRLRVVAALSDSLFQSELVMSEARFDALFPRPEGYRFFLLAPAAGAEGALTERLEDELSDFGFDVQSSGDRLAAYHRVENTYLSTFQTLGGLGLVLGTLGLGTILLRNVLERRRELALLRAVGYRRGHLSLLVTAESVLLLVVGLGTGTVSALIAIAPAFMSRGGSLPVTTTVLVLAGVFLAGLVSSAVAARVAARTPLLAALRSE